MEPLSQFEPSEERVLDGVPYVWQEINGFCNWAAVTIAFQHAGASVNMHDVFAASGIGFSFAYAQYQDVLSAINGALYRQDVNTYFASQIFGLDTIIYFDYNWELAEYNRAILESDGIPFSFVYGNDGAFDLMRSTIDRGYPLVISVDPAFLPSDDYEILRDLNATGGGHAVVIVGYDDVLGLARIMDPGVGSFGDDFGYPEDGRGNYTQVSYWDLRQAWSARHYISMTFEPGIQTGETSAQLGPVIRDRLLGVPTSYYAIGDAAIVGRYGEKAFRALGELITTNGISTFLDGFTGIDNETAFKTTLLLAIGLGMESQVTLQYLSYRTALEQLPSLMPDVDLTDFVTAGEAALPHFEVVTDNSTLIHLTNISSYTGPMASVFISMSELYNQTHDINLALSTYETDLSDISDHIIGIADSWLAAGNELAEIWPNDPLVIYGPIIIVATVGVLALITIVVFWIRKQPSQ